MATTPEEHYQVRQETLREKIANGVIHEDDGERILELAHAYDENQLSVPTPENETTKSPGTLEGCINRLMHIAEYIHLTEADVEAINDLMTELRGGKDFKKDKRAKSTIRVLQSHCRRFYDYHDDYRRLRRVL